MKPFLLLAALLFLLSLGLSVTRAAEPPLPLFLYEFNEGSDPQTPAAASTGTNPTEAKLKAPASHRDPLWSADGEGVTGQPGDYALDLRKATGMGNEGTGGWAFLSSPPLEGLKSFTLTGWFKTATTPSHGARFLDDIGPKCGFLASFDNGKLGLQVNEKGIHTDKLDYGQPGAWVFVAVTFDSTLSSDNVVFYRGVAGTLTSEKKTINDVQPPAPNSSGPLAIGNCYGGIRPLQGLIDKIAIYGSTTDGSGALTHEAIQALFSSVTLTPAP